MAASVRHAPAFDLSRVRNRIIAHIELLPSEILDHPGQAWEHPESQARALAGILGEVGIVDEPLVYKSERAHGAWVTIDGHLRKSLDPKKRWPCTVLDLTDEEADYVLATHDPIGMLKQADSAAIDALLASVTTQDAAVAAMFAEMQKAIEDIVIPDAHPQKEPVLRAEHLVQIHCSAVDLDAFMATLNEWGTRDGVTIDIS